jgi:tRNA(Ile)-lysidine synthase
VQNVDKPSSAIASVPAGAWAVGVSGGADSVALLSLLRGRADLSLRVVHLDHQTRGGASAEDAQFVSELANRWDLRCDIARLDEVIPDVPDPPANRSARFRAARLQLFRRVVKDHALGGVILAHHADDQAETILLRLLRGSGYSGLVGMAYRSVIGGLVVVRPLLNVSQNRLREHLRSMGQDWREDESNASPKYARNRVRTILSRFSELSRSLMELGASCRELHRWANQLPTPADTMPLRALQDLPRIMARQQARKWLLAKGASASELSPEALDRLIAMARDRATGRRQQFPGHVSVTRSRGFLSAESLAQR